ncbi:sporulation domain-containing protein [Sulfitobacter sp. EhC04]|nr:SPOR domain-containing protein [Sulfitobacter sp. EhC04]OAN78211.1 sporulation domain-containing protein [Sulfitobacter sp. EhC04]
MSRLISRPDSRAGRLTVMTGLALSVGLLAGCEDTGQLGFLKPKAAASTAGSTRSTKLVERDVEAPEVFNVTDQGLWDGRPSLGGVWVAHPDVTEPERVIIRNEANGKFVIGALFRRERELPGPNLQMSSDAAAALNVLAGAPAPLNVIALRREEAEETAEAEAAAQSVQAPSDVTETTLDPIASAEQAIDAAEPAPAAAAPVAPAAAKPPAPAPKPASSLSKPFVQIGIFSVEANAERAAKQMRGAGLVPTVKKSEINGKPFWRVVVGPVTSPSELNSLIKKIKGEGFSDAYAVSS